MEKSLINKIQCLNCKGQLYLTGHTHYLTCKECGEEYPVVEKSPIILSEKNNLSLKKLYLNLSIKEGKQRIVY